MGFCQARTLLRLCHPAIPTHHLCPSESGLANADSRVLEIGIGSGLGPPIYRSRVQEILRLEKQEQCDRAKVEGGSAWFDG